MESEVADEVEGWWSCRLHVLVGGYVHGEALDFGSLGRAPRIFLNLLYPLVVFWTAEGVSNFVSGKVNVFEGGEIV